MMKEENKSGRYQRIHEQLKMLFIDVNDPLSRMSTAVALLHNKFDYFFWTGFYLLKYEELIVGPYQGSLACMKLKKDSGVCWAGINKKESLIVPDVHQFPGHIACDSRSNSEIVVPLFNQDKSLIGVLDIDSTDFNAFSKADQEGLERILELIYA